MQRLPRQLHLLERLPPRPARAEGRSAGPTDPVVRLKHVTPAREQVLARERDIRDPSPAHVVDGALLVERDIHHHRAQDVSAVACRTGRPRAGAGRRTMGRIDTRPMLHHITNSAPDFRPGFGLVK